MQDLTILSFGAGQDSTTLLKLYKHDLSFRNKYAPGDFLVVMSDTGNEHHETYLHVERTKEFCSYSGFSVYCILYGLQPVSRRSYRVYDRSGPQPGNF